MITAREKMNNSNGEKGKFIKQSVTTRYSNSLITVLNVPVYEYTSGELKLTRLTRVSIKKLLKEAYENNMQEIDYDKKNTL